MPPDRRRLREHDRRIAVRIRAVREYRGLSQQDLAVTIDRPRSTVAAIEAGSRPLLLAEAVVLCRLLDVELAALVSRDPLVVRTEVTFE